MFAAASSLAVDAPSPMLVPCQLWSDPVMTGWNLFWSAWGDDVYILWDTLCANFIWCGGRGQKEGLAYGNCASSWVVGSSRYIKVVG